MRSSIALIVLALAINATSLTSDSAYKKKKPATAKQMKMEIDYTSKECLKAEN